MPFKDSTGGQAARGTQRIIHPGRPDRLKSVTTSPETRSRHAAEFLKANLRAGIDWAAEANRLRDAVVADLETSYGLAGLGDSVRVEHRMTPRDFRDELGAVDGNAFAVEPTLQQSAAFRPGNRVRSVAGMYLVGAGTHPGAGVPGVLLGAEITAGLVSADHGGGGRRTRRTRERAAASA